MKSLKTVYSAMGIALLVAAAGPAASAVELTVDATQSSVTLTTGLTPDAPITAALSGSIDLAVDPDAAPFSTAGIVSLDGIVSEPVTQQVPTALGILSFDIPANAITVTAVATGSTTNPVDGSGVFTQADLTFTLGGTLSGQLLDPDTLAMVGSFTGDLANATLTGGSPIAGQSVTATVSQNGGVTTLTAPVMLELEVPIVVTLGDAVLPLPLPVSVTSTVVASVPEPASMALLGMGGALLLTARRRAR